MSSLLRKVATMFSGDTSAQTSTSTIRLRAAAGVTTPNILDARNQNGYLAGQMLVATPVIDSGCFQKSVVYVFAHNADGATGIIINQPLELINYATLIEGVDLPKDAAGQQIPVYFGGPVERARGFIIHSTDYVRDFTLARSADLTVTSSSIILTDIVAGRGPKHAALVVGFAGWGAGQLEAEIEQNSWITVPATADLMFNTENDLKWATASKSLGIDMAFFSTAVGHA